MLEHFEFFNRSDHAKEDLGADGQPVARVACLSVSLQQVVGDGSAVVDANWSSAASAWSSLTRILVGGLSFFLDVGLPLDVGGSRSRVWSIINRPQMAGDERVTHRRPPLAAPVHSWPKHANPGSRGNLLRDIARQRHPGRGDDQ